MPSDQIQIKWREASGQDYQASWEALQRYSVAPSIKGAVTLKGNYTREALDQVVETAMRLDVKDTTLSLTASWATADSEARYVGGVNMKGDFRREDVDQLIELAREIGLEPAITLTATWGNNQEVEQMQLVAPSS